MIVIIATLLLAACTSIALGQVDKIAVEGRYKYEFGDTLQYGCGRPDPCTRVLIRDQFLQQHVNDLDGKNIRVEVTKIDACHDPRSTAFACATSGDGTAFLIVKWIRPTASP